MGWASGNEVFDPVARELQRLLGDQPQARQNIAAELIHALQQRGWDTEDESLGEFRNDPAIMAAFNQNQIYLEVDDGAPQPPPPPLMPVFTIKAKDELAPAAVAAYARLCRESGLYDQANEVMLALVEIEHWQREHIGDVHLPDHRHVPVGS